MKKIINGKRYDTETAELIKANGIKKDDNTVIPNPVRKTLSVENMVETLYQKRTGEFFLHIEKKSGAKITPMAFEDARLWMENNSTADEYEAVFEVIEEPTNITSRLKAIRGSETIASFADRFNIPRKTYENWEYGRTVPPIYVVEMIEKLAKTEGKN